MMIPYNGWDREYLENRDEYIKIFDRFMQQSKYQDINWFENKIADYVGRPHAVAVTNATDALYFSLLAHGVNSGDEVLVTDFSWISSASCISMVGATPVFCDIDIDSYHVSFESIKRMTSDKTKALIYTHLFGNMTDTTEIKTFCDNNGIVLIEDAAQALGSRLNNTLAGTVGDSSVLSFNTNKVIAGINGGGMYLTDSSEKSSYVRKLREHGKNKILGYNSKMYSLNAEIINKRFENILSYQNRRQEIAKMYTDSLINEPVHVQKIKEGLDHNYHKYVIRFEDKETRDFVKKTMSATVHYDTPLSDKSMYQNIDHRKDECINSKHVSDTILSLPIHPWLKEDEITFVIDTIKNIL